jgi:hypothetical protein
MTIDQHQQASSPWLSLNSSLLISLHPLSFPPQNALEEEIPLQGEEPVTESSDPMCSEKETRWEDVMVKKMIHIGASSSYSLRVSSLLDKCCLQYEGKYHPLVA